MAKKASSKNPVPPKKDFLVVGVGASAGGVEAIQNFFAGMPASSGMAFVVVLHLSPEHGSNLTEIIQAKTAMPVVLVDETKRVEPNRVYVIPPNRHLEMIDGVVRPVEPTNGEGSRVAIDVFFRTLAENYRENAVCVVLSGTGTDGTIGLKAIKGMNGWAIVQAPHDAEHDSMPRSAISTQLADWILPVAEMPARLIDFRDSSERLHLTGEHDEQKVADEIQADDSLREILTVLRVRTGHDFSNYKTPTLVRRIARHLQIHDLEDIPSYLEFLRGNPEEINSLLKNLLINVTNFFRDKEAWAVLEREVVPRLFEDKKGSDVLRVWSCACASGEEAYSLAMLLSEYAQNLHEPPKIQVFATDVDEDAIAEAREHRYPLSIETDVSPERLKHFFVREGKYYRIKKELREMVLFAPHNVLRDPPFSRLDLIACRNLLIYLNRETQERLMEIFHFALAPNGFLFLGSSETAESSPELFAPVDKKQRIYTRRSMRLAQQSIAPRMPVVGRWEVKLPEFRPNRRERASALSEVHHKLLEKIAPPSILVSQDFEIQYLSESSGRYLRFKGGEPTNNLLKVIHPDLLPDLRAALFTAQRENRTAEFPNIRVQIGGEETTVNLIVRVVSVENDQTEYLLVIFDENKDFPLAKDDEDKKIARAFDKNEAMEAVVFRLEEELARTKENLRTTIEQHEISVEELKASNEELQAINEELRSTTEELETSKEELQSVNEELTTVNHELKEKIDETSRTNSDLQNLMASTDIATIFLDKTLRIKRYTPPVEEIFNITRSDIGRPLEHFTHKLNYEKLSNDAERVLQKLTPIEREISDRENHFYLARFAPYRTVDDRIEGVVLNFVDITERKKAEDAARDWEEKYRSQLEEQVRQRTAELNASRDLLKATMDSSMEMIQVFEAVRDERGEIVDFKWILNNPAAEKIYGDVIGKSLLRNNPGVVREGIFDAFKSVVETGEADQSERHYVHEQFDGWFYQSVVKLGDGVATTTTDITERKTAESAVETSKEQLRATLDSSLYHVQAFEAVRNKKGKIVDFKWVFTNKAWNDQYGEMVGKSLLQENPGVVESGLFAKFVEVTETGATIDHEQFYAHEQFNGWFHQTLVKMGDGFVMNAEDITERKTAQAEILRLKDEIAQRAEDKYRVLFESIDEGYLLCEVVFDENEKAVDIAYLEANPAALRLAGLDFTGRRLREIDPDYEEYWYETIGRVALTGEPVRAEHYAETHGRWFDFYSIKVGGRESRRVATVFQDVTERKQREQQQQFLIKFSDALRAEPNIDAIADRALRMLAEHLRLDRCYVGIALLDDNRAIFPYQFGNDRVAPMPDDGVSLSDFPEALRKTFDETLVIPDFQNAEGLTETEKQNFAALGFGALVVANVRKEEKNPDWSINAVSATPRRWTDLEIRLVEEATERTWAAVERAKAEQALRASEQKYRTLFDSMDEGYCIIEMIYDEAGKAVDWRFLEVNRAFELNNGLRDARGKTIRELAPDIEEKWVEIYDRVAQSGRPLRFEEDSRALGRVFSLYAFRIGDPRERKVAVIFTDITQRKRIEEEVNESSARLAAVFAEARVGLSEISLDGRFLKVNEMLCRILGRPREDLLKLRMTDVTFADDVPATLDAVNRLIETGETISLDKRYQRPDGELVTANSTASLLKTGAGEPVMLVVTMDLTERAQAAEALRQSEERMRLATEASELATWEWHLKTGEVFWNERHFELFGLKPEDKAVTPAYFLSFVHEDDRASVDAALRKAIAERSVFDAEFRVVRADGKTCWMNGYGRVTQEDESGAPARMNGVMFDVTERREAEESLQKSEENLNLILESTKDYAIITFDLDGRITRWNAGAEKIFGWTEEEALGKSTHLIFTPEDRADGAPERELQTTLKKGRAEDERWHLRKDGSRFFASGVMQLLRDGKTEGFVKIARDQTARLEAEQMRLEQEMLRRLVAAQEQERRRIARDIHDHFGQQLTALRLQLDALKKSCGDREDLCRLTEVAQKAAEELDANVDFIAWELRPASLDDLGLRAALADFVREWSNHTRIKADFHTSGLGRGRLDYEIETNLYRIAQEALNNVQKHAQATQVSVLLEKTRNGIVSLIVEDDGVGFNPNDKANHKKGLGLIGMLERARICGGDLEIESAKGKGTTLFARIPVKK